MNKQPWAAILAACAVWAGLVVGGQARAARPVNAQVAFSANLLPLSGLQQNEAAGLFVDVLRAIEGQGLVQLQWSAAGIDETGAGTPSGPHDVLLPAYDAGTAEGRRLLGPERTTTLAVTELHYSRFVDNRQLAALRERGLCDLRHAVLRGSQSQQWLAARCKGRQDNREITTTADGLRLLAEGKVDAVLGLREPLELAIRDSALAGMLTELDTVATVAAGFAVYRDRPDLLKALNTGIRALDESGELKTIIDRWSIPAHRTPSSLAPPTLAEEPRINFTLPEPARVLPLASGSLTVVLLLFALYALNRTRRLARQIAPLTLAAPTRAPQAASTHAQAMRPTGLDALPLLSGVRVLMHEDHPGQCVTQLRCLQRWQPEVMVASGVQGLISAFADAESRGQGFDVVLTDPAYAGDITPVVAQLRALAAGRAVSILSLQAGA